MSLNLPSLYFVWTEEYCQTSPNKNKFLTSNKHLSLLYFWSLCFALRPTFSLDEDTSREPKELFYCYKFLGLLEMGNHKSFFFILKKIGACSFLSTTYQAHLLQLCNKMHLSDKWQLIKWFATYGFEEAKTNLYSFFSEFVKSSVSNVKKRNDLGE